MSLNRTIKTIYPDFSAEIKSLDDGYNESTGPAPDILYQIIHKHQPNADFNRKLYYRYSGLDGYVPIDKREPRFKNGNNINNKVRNDFFGEIVDFKTGYFSGKPIVYGYSKTEESQQSIGGEEAVKKATKAVTDFATLNNMYGADMEVTKLASIYGYAGRLFYISKPEKEPRVMIVPGYEAILLSERNKISEPKYAVRYFRREKESGAWTWIVEFYDSEKFYIYEGNLTGLVLKESDKHLFDRCPLQGIANNDELTGDAEKVLSEIDAYDKIISDNVNDLESFANAYMVFQGMSVSKETVDKANECGAFEIPSTGTGSERKIYFLTKDINDEFVEHQLDRIENNIYRFTKTPNLDDESFGTASGESLKFKLHGLETKCGMFQAKMMDAAIHMWKLLASFWKIKQIAVDPLQCTMEFSRNFPLNTLSNAQAAQALISAGVPEEIAWKIALPEIDDIDYVMQLAEEQKSSIPPINIDDGDEGHAEE